VESCRIAKSHWPVASSLGPRRTAKVASIYHEGIAQISVSRFCSAFNFSISAVKRLAFTPIAPLTSPVMGVADCDDDGLADAARTKPWKMLPKKPEELGRVSGGRWRNAWVRFCGVASCVLWFCDAAACVFLDASCCCCLATRLTSSAAARSSQYAAGKDSAGNIVLGDVMCAV